MTGDEVTASGLIVVRYGWSSSIALISAHYVWPDMPVRYRRDRPLANGLCGYPAFVDEDGHLAADFAERCGQCTWRLQSGTCGVCRTTGRIEITEQVDGGDETHIRDVDCPLCGGSGRLPALPPDALP